VTVTPKRNGCSRGTCFMALIMHGVMLLAAGEKRKSGARHREGRGRMTAKRRCRCCERKLSVNEE
jgi:hypothetical protein